MLITYSNLTKFDMMSWFKSGKSKESPLEVEDDIAIFLENVSKIYKKDGKEVQAVKNLSFSVKKGEFFAIVGRSGSGKTTLLNLIGTMEKPSNGQIAVNGKTLSVLSRSDITDMRRKDLATIYQSYNLIPVLSAFQNVELPMLLTGMSKPERRARADKLLKLVGLLDRKDHKPDELSGGEKQRVTIARALSNKPSIMLADEPTGDLDEEIGQEIIDLLEGINRDLQTTLVMVTHDRQLAHRADRIMELKEGEIKSLAEGSGKKIRVEEEESREKKPTSYY